MSEHSSPIFILGIMARSGTNFLGDLVTLHPECRLAPLHEDYLLTHADLLEKYVAAVSGYWKPEWGISQDDVYRAVGGGLVCLMSSQVGEKRLVAKTPNVRNLPLFFKLFPGARLLILVRDGRAVVESGVRSFGEWSYEKATQWWAAEARAILAFDEANRGAGLPYLLVRYEDLFNETEATMGRVLAFLRLEAAEYDFETARQMPVRGSSVFRGVEEKVHWQTVERTEEFRPLERWRGWTRGQHERFNWVAGPYMRRLGYELQEYGGQRRLWTVWNRWMDWRWRRANR